MALNEQDVTRIARLANIAITGEQRTAVQGELNDILALIEQLQAVDTHNVEPLSTPLAAHADIALRLRDDAVAPGNCSREALLANAPAVQDGLILVPKVIE
ncbi:MAG: Asp-tRNA(Asn)/Glu-tRNA(Gln) amidotransferase subunit GatC [Corticimicrobacter sp.]|uniref:Asp-tRNA(Asn)/Glu-tRNA(Gln) amidotransferase subunit GatC n=1 Tax=Corticimicrobacter sp. TaxID=2678536 RepID=UPI0032DAEA0A